MNKTNFTTKIFFHSTPNIMTVQQINAEIKNVDANQVSDGYHTFGELYEHRVALFILAARFFMELGRLNNDVAGANKVIWRSRKHSDGTEWEGWFIMGIGTEPGHQITYHLPTSQWERTDFAPTRDIAPEWDGHTSADALDRLYELIDFVK